MDIMDIAIAKALSGGGGGDGSAENFVVNFTVDYETEPFTATADKTFAEINSAFENGQNIVGFFEGYILTLTGFFPAFQSLPATFSFGLITASSAEGQIMGLTSFAFVVDGNDAIDFQSGVYDF